VDEDPQGLIEARGVIVASLDLSLAGEQQSHREPASAGAGGGFGRPGTGRPGAADPAHPPDPEPDPLPMQRATTTTTTARPGAIVDVMA
jgi:hypothetical protein